MESCSNKKETCQLKYAVKQTYLEKCLRINE